ncbi:MAG TPA: DUF167 domain-containing protein [Stellaceae bacterium]
MARDGLRLAIRLSPRARTDHLVSIAAAVEGGSVLRATVTAQAEDGRANKALLHLLARAWHLPRRDLSIIAGSTSRNKIVHIAGDPQYLVAKIAPEIARLPRE